MSTFVWWLNTFKLPFTQSSNADAIRCASFSGCGKSEGRSGSYSTNYQISGRELLTPDEVRMLDNQYAILFIRGERPVLDFKYDILKHPNVALTADGKAGVYKHGEVKSDVATIELISLDKNKAPEITVAETHYELLSDEDFETK